MPRYFIELSYKGTGYHGWQSQPHSKSVQQAVELAFKTLTGEIIKTTGAGRTDTGVHALFFVAHFNAEHVFFENRQQCLYKLNCILPEDIAVSDIYRVTDQMHARYSALSRTYEYRIHTHKNPFLNECSWYFAKPLDLDAMNLAADKIMEFSDFTSFSKLHSGSRTNICKVISARWEKHEDKIWFKVTADRFLRNMVRAMVGTMIESGTGKLDLPQLIAILEGRDRGLAGYSVPAHGLYLADIKYPAHIKANP